MKLLIKCYRLKFLRKNFSLKLGHLNFNVCEISEHENKLTFFKTVTILFAKNLFRLYINKIKKTKSPFCIGEVLQRGGRFQIWKNVTNHFTLL